MDNVSIALKLKTAKIDKKRITRNEKIRNALFENL
jgi:hypothetical protein